MPGHVTPALRKQGQAVVQKFCNSPNAVCANPASCEFDGKGYSVKPLANLTTADASVSLSPDRYPLAAARSMNSCTTGEASASEAVR